jgi:hypothetical protein
MKRMEFFQTQSYKASIFLVSKPDKYITKKKVIGQYPLMNIDGKILNNMLIN